MCCCNIKNVFKSTLLPFSRTCGTPAGFSVPAAPAQPTCTRSLRKTDHGSPLFSAADHHSFIVQMSGAFDDDVASLNGLLLAFSFGISLPLTWLVLRLYLLINAAGPESQRRYHFHVPPSAIIFPPCAGIFEANRLLDTTPGPPCAQRRKITPCGSILLGHHHKWQPATRPQRRITYRLRDSADQCGN